MKKLLCILVLIPFLIGCAPNPSAGIGTSCDSLQPTQGDIQYALNVGSDLYTEAVWNRSYTVHELDVIVSWTHRSVAALSDVSMLLFCNENGTGDLELFYNNDTIKDNFSNYDSINITASCNKDNVYLYEVDAVEEGENYTIREWIQPLSKTRLLTVVTVFPKEDTALVEKYSKGLFPALPSCQ